MQETLSGEAGAGTVNTSYVERWHGTNRHLNARKARKVYTLSKDLLFHVAVTWLCVVFSNFGWKPRTLREQIQADPPRYQYRTPAMAAGLTDEPWSWKRILIYPLHRPDAVVDRCHLSLCCPVGVLVAFLAQWDVLDHEEDVHVAAHCLTQQVVPAATAAPTVEVDPLGVLDA